MSDPTLSVAVLTGPLRERAQRVVQRLAEQSVAAELEVLVIDLEQDAAPIAVPDPLRGLHVPLPGALLSHAKGEAVRRASAPVVAFLEDHCYPEDGWAEAVIDAHRGPWAAVGYAFVNANPGTWVSRAALVADYGRFLDPAPHGPADFLSGNNVSYRRDALLALGDRLDDLLVVDYNVQQALLARGERLFIDSRALVAHENFESVGDLGRANLTYCRVMAAVRASGWSRARRWFYALAAPIAAPVLKLVRLARSLAGRPGLVVPTITALPVIVTVYGYAAAGESRGYLDEGADEAESEFLRWELETVRDRSA
jgi:hypothetical protein